MLCLQESISITPWSPHFAMLTEHLHCRILFSKYILNAWLTLLGGPTYKVGVPYASPLSVRLSTHETLAKPAWEIRRVVTSRRLWRRAAYATVSQSAGASCLSQGGTRLQLQGLGLMVLFNFRQWHSILTEFTKYLLCKCSLYRNQSQSHLDRHTLPC